MMPCEPRDPAGDVYAAYRRGAAQSLDHAPPHWHDAETGVERQAGRLKPTITHRSERRRTGKVIDRRWIGANAAAFVVHEAVLTIGSLRHEGRPTISTGETLKWKTMRRGAPGMPRSAQWRRMPRLFAGRSSAARDARRTCRIELEVMRVDDGIDHLELRPVHAFRPGVQAGLDRTRRARVSSSASRASAQRLERVCGEVSCGRGGRRPRRFTASMVTLRDADHGSGALCEVKAVIRVLGMAVGPSHAFGRRVAAGRCSRGCRDGGRFQHRWRRAPPRSDRRSSAVVMSRREPEHRRETGTRMRCVRLSNTRVTD